MKGALWMLIEISIGYSSGKSNGKSIGVEIKEERKSVHGKSRYLLC